MHFSILGLIAVRCFFRISFGFFITALAFIEGERNELVTKLSFLCCEMRRTKIKISGSSRSNNGGGGSRLRSIVADFAVAVGPNNVRKLASFGRAATLLGEVGALPDMLLGTVQTLFAEAENSKISTYTFTRTDIDVRERAIFSITAAFVEEMNTDRGAFRDGVVRKVAA